VESLIGWPIVSRDYVGACRVSAPIVTMDSMIESGAILAKIGLCYLVTSWRDFSSCGKNMPFAVYGETTRKIIARGWPL